MRRLLAFLCSWRGHNFGPAALVCRQDGGVAWRSYCSRCGSKRVESREGRTIRMFISTMGRLR